MPSALPLLRTCFGKVYALDEKTKNFIKGYLEKARKKLEVAQKLFDLGEYEDAISRAYYAAFHAAQALLLSRGEKATTHQGVLTLFGLLFIATGELDRKFGKYLARLKDVREGSDYEIFSFTDEETAREMLQAA